MAEVERETAGIGRPATAFILNVGVYAIRKAREPMIFTGLGRTFVVCRPYETSSARSASAVLQEDERFETKQNSLWLGLRSPLVPAVTFLASVAARLCLFRASKRSRLFPDVQRYYT